MRTVLCVALVVGSVVGSGCRNAPAVVDREAEVAAVSAAIDASINWCIPDKSRERLHAHIAHDSAFFIFHPDSRSTIVGHDHFTRYSDAIFFDPRFTPIGAEIRDLRVNISRSGDVAWFSCILDDRGIWDGEPFAWLNSRWTGVLEKRDGTWLIVQQHFSLPTDAADLEDPGEEGNPP